MDSVMRGQLGGDSDGTKSTDRRQHASSLTILYLCKTSILAANGGGEMRADRVTSRLTDAGHDVTILSGKTAPGLPARDEVDGREIRHVACVPELAFSVPGIAFYAVRYLFALCVVPALLRRLVVDDVDVIVENMTPYPTLAIIAAKATGVPIVAVQHEHFDFGAYRVYDLVTATIQLAVQNLHRVFAYDALIVPTAHVKREFEQYGARSRQIRVVPNGIEPDAYDLPAVQTVPDKLVVVGRLTKRKDHDELVEVLARVRACGCDATLDIVGTGTERSSIETRVKQLGLDGAVRFHGYVSEERKRELLNRASLFVFASEQEGFGIALLEAMAAGLPIVARRHPVYETFFTHGLNGYLVPNDREAFADAVVGLLEDADRRAEMGRANRRVAKEFSWGSVAESTEDVLLSVAEVGS